MSTRRQFLQHSALVSLAPLVPAFLSRSALAAEAKSDARVLVVIQLDGGNDGLNTVIPHADENYPRFRRELRIKANEILKLNESIGLHPGMKPAAELFEDGRLTIVQGVGYPNPNRSHFESMSIWHHARLAAEDHDGNGWLGRAAEHLPARSGSLADAIYVGADAVPVALRGRRANAVSLQNESDLQLAGDALASSAAPAASPDLAAFVERTLAQSFAAARQFKESNSNSKSTSKYPASPLAEKLELISRLLKLGGGTRIYYVSQPGYDTHAAQAYAHYELLDEFSFALKAFLDDLQAAQLADRVLVLAFSEFGRRVQENASAGTDHGAAAPIFLAGAPVKPGIVGSHPSLTDLDDGDLKAALDFRQVYATLLHQWLRLDSQALLHGQFAELNLLA
jgi:uncharacterized protein (DUF1501 family)